MKSMKMIRAAVLISMKMLPALAIFCCTVPALAADENYSGGFLNRSTLTGDWGGIRNDLAKKGVTFDLNLTQVEQGVTGGGKRTGWEGGGRGDLIFKVDTGKLGLWPGGFLTAELEGNWGEGVNGPTGAVSAVNSNQIFPVTGENVFAMPALNFAQFLSEYFGLVFGKLDVMSGDANDFAHGKYGKGDTQFMNLALNIDPALLFTAPYTPLGAGLVILPNKDPNAAIVTLTVISSDGKANTAGFDQLDNERLSYNIEGRMRTDFFGHTGHQLLGAIGSDKEFVSIDQRLILERGSNSIARKTGSWAVYYNFDQYLYEPEKGSGKGLGIFGRFAVTDGNPNFLHHFFSLGVGGNGVLPSRPYDRFGVGWYYININNPTFTGPIQSRAKLRDEQGVEAFYSVALTPWAHLTPDLQVIHGAQEKTVALLPANRSYIETATILGLRLHLMF
jgi:porin